MTSRPDNAQGTEFFAAVACYCGGYSACAHKMAIASTQAEADALACAKWNSRKLPPNAADVPPQVGHERPVLPNETNLEKST